MVDFCCCFVVGKDYCMICFCVGVLCDGCLCGVVYLCYGGVVMVGFGMVVGILW